MRKPISLAFIINLNSIQKYTFHKLCVDLILLCVYELLHEWIVFMDICPSLLCSELRDP